LQMCTPANTPATPPNFPDTLTMFSRLKASESFTSSSPIASMATSPPPQVSWAMTPPPPSQQGLWTPRQPPSQAPPPGWPATVTQQAASEQKASVVMEAER
ncbi:UBAD1 protein, partial [Polyodon spathula]|nr:UBAD1 protein [Polyodon spathula]